MLAWASLRARVRAVEARLDLAAVLLRAADAARRERAVLRAAGLAAGFRARLSLCGGKLCWRLAFEGFSSSSSLFEEMDTDLMLLRRPDGEPSKRTPVCNPLREDCYTVIISPRENPATGALNAARACNRRNMRSIAYRAGDQCAVERWHERRFAPDASSRPASAGRAPRELSGARSAGACARATARAPAAPRCSAAPPGPLHTRASSSRAAVADDRVAEAPPHLVLTQLHLQPQEALEHPPGQAADLAAAVQRGAQARQRRQHLGADRVHRVLGVPLDQRHHRLNALDQLPAVLAERQAQQLPARARSTSSRSSPGSGSLGHRPPCLGAVLRAVCAVAGGRVACLLLGCRGR